MAVGEQLQQHSKQWVLNTSCYYYICPHRHWFLTYDKNSGGSVLMGNDAPCKSIGIGLVQIRMHDGLVRTLTEVRHV